MSDELKLKACPFCGNENAFFSNTAWGKPINKRQEHMFVVNCQGCPVSTSVPMHSKEFAAQVWNKRFNKRGD